MNNNFIQDEHIGVFVKIYKQPRASLLITKGVDLHQQFANELMVEIGKRRKHCVIKLTIALT